MLRLWIDSDCYIKITLFWETRCYIDCVNSSLDGSSEFGFIITACKQLPVDRFQNSHVEFSRRQANRVAHELAQVALSNPSPHVINDVPTCIWHILANEMQ